MTFDNHKKESQGTAALRTACMTLRNTLPDVIRSISLTIRPADLPVVASSPADVVERIAAEYGLVVQTRVDEHVLVVRLTRPDGPSQSGVLPALPVRDVAEDDRWWNTSDAGD